MAVIQSVTRRVQPVSLLSRSRLSVPALSRAYALKGSDASGKSSMGPSRSHLHDRTEEENIQSKGARDGFQERSEGSHKSQAASEKDVHQSNKKSESDHPEAPKPVIGMNDERGGKGH